MIKIIIENLFCSKREAAVKIGKSKILNCFNGDTYKKKKPATINK